MKEERIVCDTPTPGKQPTTILKWKYDVVKNAILQAIPKNDDGIRFTDLLIEVDEILEQQGITDLGSTSWYTTTVKLDMEVKGKIKRIPGETPQRLIQSN